MIQIVIYVLGWLTYGSTSDMRDWVGQLLMYIYATIDSGDPANDWLTHILDPQVREVARMIGDLLCSLLGL